MDARLLTIRGHRPVFLRRIDLPALAGAIVDYFNHRVRAYRVYQAQIGGVLLQGPGVDILVRQEDWAKITPHLVNGTFAPPNNSVVNSPSRQARRTADMPAQQADADLYDRILATLQTIFTDEFPTSAL